MASPPKTRDFHGLPADRVDDGYERLSSPSRGFRASLAKSVLNLCGWKLGGAPPRLDKYIVVAAPHTSWWDGFWMIAFAWSWGLRVHWLGKASLATGPLGWIPRKFGIIPVERSAPQQLVAEIARQFDAREEMVLSMPPEGTRGRREYWKSGFLRIAAAAGVPLCLSYLDYDAREAGFGPCFMPGDDMVADMDRVRAFYKASWAKYPSQFTPPRLRDELESPGPGETAAGGSAASE